MARTRVAQTEQGMQFEGTFKCPHCDHENHHWFGYWASGPEVVNCDSEFGGCGTYFAVTASVDVIVTVTPRKIEGIAPSRATLDAWIQGDEA